MRKFVSDSARRNFILQRSFQHLRQLLQRPLAASQSRFLSSTPVLDFPSSMASSNPSASPVTLDTVNPKVSFFRLFYILEMYRTTWIHCLISLSAY